MKDSSTTTTTFTIGYAKRSLDELIDLLEKRKIRYVIDVRSRPYSKFKPEFSRRALQGALERKRFRYVFMGDLLGAKPDDPACYDQDGYVNYLHLKTTKAFRRGIARLRVAWEKQLRVCLLCSEARPEVCHRSKLIGRVLEEEEGIPVLHFDEDGALRTQADVMARRGPTQPALFPGMPSRSSWRSEKKGHLDKAKRKRGDDGR